MAPCRRARSSLVTSSELMRRSKRLGGWRVEADMVNKEPKSVDRDLQIARKPGELMSKNCLEDWGTAVYKEAVRPRSGQMVWSAERKVGRVEPEV